MFTDWESQQHTDVSFTHILTTCKPDRNLNRILCVETDNLTPKLRWNAKANIG